MNNQEALDKAVAGIIAQDALAQIFRGEQNPPLCSYRNEHGHKCAVGQLLDDNTAQDWQDRGVGSIRDASDGQIARANLQDVDINFLAELQIAHDSARTIDEFVSGAQKLATKYDLAFNPS